MSLAPRDRRLVLITTSACVFVNFVCLLGLTPLYPDVGRDLGLSADGLGALLGGLLIGSALLQLPVGVANDRLGSRRVLGLGLATMALAQLLRWQAGSVLVFGLSQALLGLCAPLVISSSYTAVANAYPRSGQAQALGTVTAGVYLGQASGYLLSGAVGGSLGWRTLSLLLALPPLLLLPSSLRLPEAHRTDGAPTVGGTTMAAARLIANPRLIALGAIAALALGSGYSSTYLLPFVLRSHGLGASATSLLLLPYVAGCVVGATVTGWLADRIGVRGPMLGGLCAGALGVTLLALVGDRSTAVIAGLAAIGISVASALGLTATLTVTLARDLEAGTGSALGALRLGQAAGPVLGPSVSGFVFVRWGLSASFYQLTADLLIAMVLVVLATRSTRSGATTTSPQDEA